LINPKEKNKIIEEKEDKSGTIAVGKFATKIVGLTQHIKLCHEEDKIKKNIKNNINEEAANKNSILMPIVKKVIQIIIFVLFLIFTLISLIKLRPAEKAYFMNYANELKFKSGIKPGPLSVHNLKESIGGLISDMFLDPSLNMAPITKENSIASPIRVSFYKTKEKECDAGFISEDIICYHPQFENLVADSKIEDKDFYLTNARCKNLI